MNRQRTPRQHWRNVVEEKVKNGVREETSLTSELCKGHSENYGFTGTEKESHLRR